MKIKTKCPICGTEFEGGIADECPYCDWLYLGQDDDIDDPDTGNPLTVRQAKENLKKKLKYMGGAFAKRETLKPQNQIT